MNSLSDLTCTNCNEVFNSTNHIPRLLVECGHTLCTLCIESLLIGAENSSGFACPDDGILCGINKKTAEEFPKNLSLLRIIERQSANKENINNCVAHHKKLEVVCIDCKKRLCSKCALFEGHRVHELRPEEDVYSEIMVRKELLQDMLQMINDNHEVVSNKNKWEEAYEKCEAREKELSNKIEEKFSTWIKMLNERKVQALQAIINISTSIKGKIREFQGFSKDLPDQVEKWKLEATKKLKGDNWTEALSLIEVKTDSSKDFLHVGEEILEELARIKASLLHLNIEELVQGWLITFNNNIERDIEECYGIKNPFDINGPLPILEFDEVIEEIVPIRLEEGNLLNESGSFYENCCLANLSPNKRLSLTRSIAEGHNRYSARLSLAKSVIS